MKNLWILPLIFLVLTNNLRAQTKAAVKADTINHKAAIPKAALPDTSDKKTTLNLQIEKLAKSDSASLKLSPKKRAADNLKADIADLNLTSCDFEKDANAMVLDERGVMAFGVSELLIAHHKRIKIFNDNGKDEANVHIKFNNKFGLESILGLEGRTINLDSGKVKYTKLDQKLVYLRKTDKDKYEVVFSFPNVKAGSVIEYEYVWGRDFSRNFPEWDFQNNIPTKYSQVDVFFTPAFSFSASYRTNRPFVKDTLSTENFGHVWAMDNVPASKIEPFMHSAVDALQSIALVLTTVSLNGKTKDLSGSWAVIGKQVADDKEINKAFNQSIPDESDIVKKVNALGTADEKISWLFNFVKTSMIWNEEKAWLSKDGIKAAWKKKSGNWGEINMILCHLLKQSGIKAYPMLVSTRDNGSIAPAFANIYQINKLVTYIPVDSTRHYVLDATDKYNTYNEIPFDLLNTSGLYLNKEQEKYELVDLKKDAPVKQIVSINAEIKPDGTMTGTTQMNSFSYNKAVYLELHKKLDEQQYIAYLKDGDNNLSISSLKLENAEVDSLPLTQKMDFKLDLPGTDDKYIYFNPNLFTSLHNNPFISESRASDVDFGCCYYYAINGRYTIPAGYKVESLPQSKNLLMADKSISFRRAVAEQDGVIVVYYVISYKKSLYPRVDYPDLYAYFKEMGEMLNEQIVLKKI